MKLGIITLVILIFSASAYARINSANDSISNVAINATGEELSELQDLVDQTERIVTSNLFANNLKYLAGQKNEIFLNANEKDNQNNSIVIVKTAEDLLAILKGLNPKFHFHPTILSLTGTYYSSGNDYVGQCQNASGVTINCKAKAFPQNYSNQMVVTHGINKRESLNRETVAIEIGREIHNRYKSSNLIEKSCGINSFSHEWSHTIGEKDFHLSSISDTNNGVLISTEGNIPFASYLIGTTAQCTWLQDVGRIDKSNVALDYCVKKFGIKKFRSNNCTAPYSG